MFFGAMARAQRGSKRKQEEARGSKRKQEDREEARGNKRKSQAQALKLKPKVLLLPLASSGFLFELSLSSSPPLASSCFLFFKKKETATPDGVAVKRIF